MTLDEPDRKMRLFKSAPNICVLQQIFMGTQIDDRSFTRLTLPRPRRIKIDYKLPLRDEFSDFIRDLLQ